MRYVKLLLGGLLLLAVAGVIMTFNPYGTSAGLPEAVWLGQMFGDLLIGWGGFALLRSGMRHGKKPMPKPVPRQDCVRGGPHVVATGHSAAWRLRAGNARHNGHLDILRELAAISHVSSRGAALVPVPELMREATRRGDRLDAEAVFDAA